jgi:hypothetical protein
LDKFTGEYAMSGRGKMIICPYPFCDSDVRVASVVRKSPALPLISVTVNVAREKRGAMLRGFCSGDPEAVLETPVGARCEGCA